MNCPKVEKCPLFNGTLLKRAQSAETYKNLYCTNETNYANCKRFITAQKFGTCPTFVLPNSSYSLEEIESRMHKEGTI